MGGTCACDVCVQGHDMMKVEQGCTKASFSSVKHSNDIWNEREKLHQWGQLEEETCHKMFHLLTCWK